MSQSRGFSANGLDSEPRLEMLTTPYRNISYISRRPNQLSSDFIIINEKDCMDLPTVKEASVTAKRMNLVDERYFSRAGGFDSSLLSNKDRKSLNMPPQTKNQNAENFQID